MILQIALAFCLAFCLVYPVWSGTFFKQDPVAAKPKSDHFKQ